MTRRAEITPEQMTRLERRTAAGFVPLRLVIAHDGAVEFDIGGRRLETLEAAHAHLDELQAAKEATS